MRAAVLASLVATIPAGLGTAGLGFAALDAAGLDVAGPAAARSPSAEEPVHVRFDPPPDTTVRKVFTTSGRRELERLEVRTDEVTSEPEGLSIVVTGSKRLVVVDRYERVAGGRLLDLERTYEVLDAKRKLTTVLKDERETVFATDACDVEGRTVRFRSTPDGYARSYADGADATEDRAEPAELAGLAADLDLLALLPPGDGAVTNGDEWPVPFEAFRAVLRPGGELACRSEPPEGEGERELADRVWSSLAGEVTARYAGPVAEPAPGRDGRAGRVRIVFEGAYTGSGRIDVVEVGVTGRRMSTAMRVEGELVWDLALARATSLSMTSTGSATTIDDIRVLEGGVEREFERVLTFREESTLAAAFE